MNQPMPAEQGFTTGGPNGSPIAAALAQDQRGVSADGGYVVLPAAVLEALPAPVKQQVAAALAEIHRAAPAGWPAYQVTASRRAPVAECTEHQLRDAGIVTVLDDTGQLEYQWARNGERVDPQHQVLVACPDPLLRSGGEQPPAGR